MLSYCTFVNGVFYVKYKKTQHFISTKLLKSSRNKKDFNDVTAAWFSVSFSQLPAAKKPTKNWAAVTSLRSFLFCDNFSTLELRGSDKRTKSGGTHYIPSGQWICQNIWSCKLHRSLLYVKTYLSNGTSCTYCGIRH